ncbi:hypothetical protein WJ94_27585 [Burkholderia ubonensis]|nr:hypothetical protein WJ94_27585 [Burkholderia ubonensis]KVV53393.1 hypothetical protein WK82_08670 [Burkholderia ubonensis]OJA56559.1 hypothetical protein BGV69_18550 [Burkholderia ubonensis]OJB17618.1 hypothetical protein BGV54_21475 [Burkholderia ubonensis]
MVKAICDQIDPIDIILTEFFSEICLLAVGRCSTQVLDEFALLRHSLPKTLHTLAESVTSCFQECVVEILVCNPPRHN